MSTDRIAVVGSGISGVGAAWLLSRRYDVTLFEAQDRVGGHTNTVDVERPDGSAVGVDTGFIVYNEPNYPQLTALLRHLGVATQPTDMSFGFSCAAEDIEYAGDNLNTFFGQRRNLLRPSFWRMAGDILRFNADARMRLNFGMDDACSLGDYLQELGVGREFREHYLLPMSAAIWSCPPEEMLAFPASRFLRFFKNHGLIQLTGRPAWRTVAGGSRNYLRRMLPQIARVATASPVRRVTRRNGGIELFGDHGLLGHFDQVVIAAHADQALAMLEQPSADESRLLGAFRYQPNTAVLHTDDSAMPRRRAVWSSWNHLSDGQSPQRPVAVTYWMNRLQRLTEDRDYFVTLNPIRPIAEDKILRSMTYDHPVFDSGACAAQQSLGQLQGSDGIWYCGSYFGYGFHEDGFRSAVSVAAGLGVAAPWKGATAQPAPSPASSATEPAV